MSRTHIDTYVDSNYLGQGDLLDKDGNSRDVVVEIEAVKRYTPEVRRKKKMPDGRVIDEPLKRVELRFKGKRKGWLAGPVSRKILKNLFGNFIEDWIGKKITLYVDHDVMMGRDRVGGVRVRPKVPTGPATQEPLDKPVDQEAAAVRDKAFGREPGEEG